MHMQLCWASTCRRIQLTSSEILIGPVVHAHICTLVSKDRAAGLPTTHPCPCCRKLTAADTSTMHVVVLAHIAALQLVWKACAEDCGAVCLATHVFDFPVSCLPVAAAAGAAALVQLEEKHSSQVRWRLWCEVGAWIPCR